MRKIKKATGQPATRSDIAIAAHFATGAGSHGGSKRQKSRRDRQSIKREIQNGI